jgi:hypothetical protein
MRPCGEKPGPAAKAAVALTTNVAAAAIGATTSGFRITLKINLLELDLINER